MEKSFREKEEFQKLVKLEQDLKELKELLKLKEKEKDNFEIDIDAHEDEYCESLNSEGEIKVAGLTFDADQIIRELDPTAYRCGLIDYCDSLDVTEEKEYKEIEKQIEELEDRIYDLESEIEDMRE